MKKDIILVQGVFKDEVLKKNLKKHKGGVFILEGRPSLHAGQTNAKALLRLKKKPTLIADNMAGLLFYKNMIKEVWVAYQFHASKGALCDIGAMILAVLARKHKVALKLFPAAEKTAFFGKPKDLLSFKGTRIAPASTPAFVPLVEWVPNKYITKVWKTS